MPLADVNDHQRILNREWANDTTGKSNDLFEQPDYGQQPGTNWLQYQDQRASQSRGSSWKFPFGQWWSPFKRERIVRPEGRWFSWGASENNPAYLAKARQKQASKWANGAWQMNGWTDRFRRGGTTSNQEQNMLNAYAERFLVEAGRHNASYQAGLGGNFGKKVSGPRPERSSYEEMKSYQEWRDALWRTPGITDEVKRNIENNILNQADKMASYQPRQDKVASMTGSAGSVAVLKRLIY